MKLVKHCSLYFQEGRSDKVYEVDLCEVGSDQFVVNFRYGRRGGTLRDGTKTVAPVTEAEAETIYADLVESKTNKGYQHSSTSGASTSSSTAAISQLQGQVEQAEATSEDPRKKAVLARLAAGHDSDSGWSLSRAVWRAGELRLRETEPALLKLIGSGDEMLEYCLAWSLAQLGSEQSIEPLRAINSNEEYPYRVRRMAVEALRQICSGSKREALVNSCIQKLPEALHDSARNGPAETFQQLLVDLLDGADRRATTVLEHVYLVDNQHVRPALLHVLRMVPLKVNYFLRIRRIFKSAELRRDGEVFGILAHRFEREKANFRMKDDWHYRYHETPKPTIGANATNAFSVQTRLYLRRRVWWTLRRLGELQDPDYVRLATGVLLAFTDDDAQSIRESVDYVHERGSWASRPVFFDQFSGYWAFSQILFKNSPRYQPPAECGKSFRCVPPFEPGGPVPPEREEAFPDLWEQHPATLLQLLVKSRCQPVHEFAVKPLRACDDFCRQIELDVIKKLLTAPYDATVQFSFDLAVSRYDPNNPDRELVLALANCVFGQARSQAHRWIEANRSWFFEDGDFTLAMITSPQPETRAFARDALRSVSLNQHKVQVLIGRLVAFLTALGTEDGEVAADVTNTMSRLFAEQLRKIGPDVIRDLLAHPLAEVQIFAGELVLNHETFAQQPPEDVLRALLNANDASVRGIGVRIISQLPEGVLKRSEDLLVALTRHELVDIRNEMRPIVKRLAASDSPFGQRLAARLVDALLVPGAPEGVPSHTCRVLREDLRDHLRSIPADMVWKLLQSRSSPAQEIGGLLLSTNVDEQALSIEEIVKLASHDILTVREASWQMCRNSIDRLRSAMPATVRILDAKWEDSRKFAFELFRQHFDNGHMTPDILVSICDSVRPDVQQFGRELITRRFQEEHGQEYLLKLSEHPRGGLQLFATNFLERFAVDSPDRLQELTLYFITVLSQVNRGRVAKDRVLSFLSQEAKKCEDAARIVADILNRVSATCAIGDRARSIEIMADIHDAFPLVKVALHFEPVEVR